MSKPLMVEPVLPRFANVSDTIQARALVLNESGKPSRVRVSLALDDKAVSEAGTNLSTTVEVPAGGSAIASFPVALAKMGEAKWQWRAGLAEDPNGYADVLSTLAVGSPLPLLRESAFVRLDAPSTNLLSGFNPQ